MQISYIFTAKTQKFQPPKAPSKRKLEKARNLRDFEKRMWDVIKETVFYFCFLVLISFIAWGSKDDTIYKMNSNILHTFGGANGRFAGMKVHLVDYLSPIFYGHHRSHVLFQHYYALPRP